MSDPQREGEREGGMGREREGEGGRERGREQEKEIEGHFDALVLYCFRLMHLTNLF